MGRITGAQLLVKVLRAHGVSQLFGLPGVGNLPVYDACLGLGMPIIGGRHEGAVVHTAEGWARLSGQPAVALMETGPGHANSIPGIATAFYEGSPVITLSTIDCSSDLGRGAVQEIPQIEMCAPITKRSSLLADARRIPEQIATAFRLTRAGAAGPVHISVTSDALEQPVDEGDAVIRPPSSLQPTHGCAAESDFADHAVDLLSRAERPAIIAGTQAYWSRVGQPLKDLIEISKIPLFTLGLARGIMSEDHPQCFGDAFGSGRTAIARILRTADVIMVIGEKIDARFAYGRSFGDARVIHIYPEADEIGRNRSVALGVSCDCRLACVQMLDAAEQKSWMMKTSWLQELREASDAFEHSLRQIAASDQVPLHPLRIAKEVESLADDDTIYVLDGGNVAQWGAALLKPRRPGGLQTTAFMLGVGIPYALGAKLAVPDAKVVVLTGDGALGFSLMEMDTAIRHHISMVVVVGNDAAWGIEEHFQSEWYGSNRVAYMNLCNVRWDDVARAFGGWGEFVDSPEGLRPALRRAFASDTLAVVNVATATMPSPAARSISRFLMKQRAETCSAG